jgi:protein O-mannosyl-transferase
VTIPRLPGFRDRRSALGISILLFALVVWAFYASTRNGFIDYDDAVFVTANPQVQSGLTWQSVGYAFCSPVAANWHPLTILSHMGDCQLYGLNPWGHHLTNVLLHAANTVLLFLVLRRMTGAVWRSAVLAALFGLHPLRVESVAWVAERKDVLSALFWMLTMLMYARYVEQSKVQSPKSKVAYVLALVFFACGLMSKPMLVTVPFVLLLLDYWPLNRFELSTQNSRLKTLLPLVWEKLPFFVLAAVCSVITLLVQEGAGAVVTELPLGARVANALVSYVRYVGKMFWPENLSVFYPHPRQWPAWQVTASVALLLAIFGAVILLARRRPYLGVGWLWFCGTLVPVIGLVQVGNQSMADRYSYVPSVGLCIMLVWGVHELFARWRYRTVTLSVLALGVTLLCLALTHRQIGWWKDGETLWLHALAVTKENHLAKYNLGVVYFNRGVSLATQGAFDEAIREYEKAIRLDPGGDDAHSSLAYALLKTGQDAEAIREYEVSLRLSPKDAEAHNNLGNILARQGRVVEATPHITEALRLKPNYPEAHDNLGAILAGQGRYAEAAAQFQEVLRLKPDYPGVAQKLERALAAQRQLE